MKKKAQRIKKPPAKNRPLERSSLINLNHGSKLYIEPGSENDDLEEIKREKNTKNTKELAYNNISSYERGEQAKQQKIRKSETQE